jgi:hypothetical protein
MPQCIAILQRFQKEVSNGENAYGVVSDFAGQTKESRTENITIKEPIIESIERFRTISDLYLVMLKK